ncbi:hypothetical protein ACSUZJ_08695 [Telluria sp. B2]
MDFAHAAGNPRQRQRYATGIGVSLAVHGLLISLWQLSQWPQRPEDAAPAASMLLRLLPARPPEPAVPPLPPPRGTAPPAARAAAGHPGKQEAEESSLPSLPRQAAIGAVTPAESQTDALPAAPVPSARELLSRAKAAAGGIDRTLRRENPQRGIVAPVVTAQMKLEKGIAEAADMAPNKWYQAPKTQEIMDPGGYGRRRYRVVGPRGTYCVTYESNHGPDGRDSMRDGLPPKMTNCDPDEGPATFQKWNDAPAPAPRAPFKY